MRRGKPGADTSLRRQAEKRLRKKTSRRSQPRGPKSDTDPQRLLHELQVHQVELELQNAELRRTQGELEAALQRYTDFYDFTPAGYLTLKPDSTIRQANLTVAGWLGVERSRLLKRRFATFVAADSRPTLNALLTRAFRSKAPEVGEVRLSIKGKPPVTVQLQARVPEGGQECRVVLTDITGHRQVEEALREASQFSQQIVRNAQEGVVVHGRDLRYQVWNPFMERLTGMPAAQVLGRHALEVFPFLREAGLIEVLNRALAGETSSSVEFPYQIPETGRSGWTWNTTAPLRNASGAIVGVIATVRDITEQKRAEQARERSDEALRLAANAAGFGTYSYDFESGTGHWSPEFKVLLGLKPDAVLCLDEDKVFVGLHPEDRPAFLSAMTAANDPRGDGLLRLEYRILLPDGSVRWLSVRGLTSFTGKGPARHAVRAAGVVLNITERKRAEEQLQSLAIFPRRNPAPVIRVGGDGIVIMSNPVAAELGITPGARLGELLPVISSIGFSACIASGQKLVREAALGGRHFQFSIQGEPALHFAQIYGADITERKRTENALRESEEQFRNLFEQMFSGFILAEVLLDRDGNPVDHRLLQVNSAFERMTGLRRSEELGRTSADLSFQWPPEVAQAYYRVALGGEPLHLERFNESLQRHYDVRAFSPRRGQFALLFLDMTERKQAEEALRRSRALLESVTEGTSDAIFVKDLQGRYLMLNSAAGRFVGKTKGEVLGRDDTAFFTPDEARQMMAADRQILASGDTHTYEEPLTAGGVARAFLVTKGPVRDAQGKVIGVFGIARDITERKRAEEALQRSRQWLALHVQQTPLAVIEFDLDGRIREWNPAAVAIFGFSREEVLGQHWTFIVPEPTRGSLKGVWAAIVKCRGGTRSTNNNRTKDGRIISCEWFNTTLTDPQGNAIGVASLVMDITERQQAQEALCRSEAELKAIYDNAPTMMCVLNASRQVIYANRAFAEFVGRPVEELKLERACGVIGCLRALDDPQGCGHGPHCADCAVRLAMLDALATGRSYHAIEYRTTALCRGQPRDSVFLASIAPIQISGQSDLLLCLEDITEREQAQEALRQLSGSLLQLQDEERRRVARELHDTVAQSLTALSLNLALLRSLATALNPRSTKLLADSQALADQCANEIRTYSYLLHPPILDELGLAGAMRDHADGFARRSGLRVDLELPPDLARLPRTTELALFRVLQEALVNIQRHSGSRTASISLAQTANQIRLEVRDRGHGMSLKSAPGRASGSGTVGVGISGMRERLRQLGGRLEIQSDAHGTSVIATLPRNQETRPA